jgi:hypothetical protein
MVHEYGHLISSILLGFGGTIFSGKPWAVYPLVKPVGDQWILFYLSGGLFQFIVFYLMSLRAQDLNTKIANRMTALIGLIEGITEPIRYLRLTGLGATLGITISFLYLAYILVKESQIE